MAGSELDSGSTTYLCTYEFDVGPGSQMNRTDAVVEVETSRKRHLS